MQLIDFDKSAKGTDKLSSIDPARLQWIDLEREEARDIDDHIPFIQGVLHKEHQADLCNNIHPPLFESTDQYEILIVRSVDDRFLSTKPQTRSIAFILFENTVITVHDRDDDTLSGQYKRWIEKKQRYPRDVLDLLHALLDMIGDAYLSLREPLNVNISDWQRKLLDPNDPFNDWQVLIQAKSSLRWLNINLELQRDILQRWRDETRYDLSQSHMIQFNDLDSHLGRIERLSDSIRSDIDSLTNVYFASTGQKTNTIVQFLAVISAVFLPLNLIAGLFGMNFEHLPFLHSPWSPPLVVILMLAQTALLLWWFKKRRWF
jgi:magnesium/cobalt transport protein CorA